MKELFTKLKNVHGYNTRGSQLNFHVPKVNFVSSTTFFFNGIKQWNILPSNMKEIFTKNTFKHVAKTHLFNYRINMCVDYVTCIYVLCIKYYNIILPSITGMLCFRM